MTKIRPKNGQLPVKQPFPFPLPFDGELMVEPCKALYDPFDDLSVMDFGELGSAELTVEASRVVRRFEP